MKTAAKYKIIALVLAALLLLGGLVFLLISLLKPEVIDPHAGQVYINDGFGMVWMTPLEGVDVNEFQQIDFRIINSQPHFTGEGYEVQRGIDVSEHQLEIDWAKAAKNLDYAYVRLGYRGYTEGGMFEDPYFKANVQGALKNGLEVGVYFFSQAVTAEEAIEEAEFVLERIEGMDISLPIVFDWEKIEGGGARTDGLEPEVLNDCAVAFCETVKAAGYEPCVYFNRYLGYYMYDLQRINDYRHWLAVPGDFPDFYYAVDMWQYSFEKEIPGIDNLTDMNLRFVKLPEPSPSPQP